MGGHTDIESICCLLDKVAEFTYLEDLQLHLSWSIDFEPELYDLAPPIVEKVRAMLLNLRKLKKLSLTIGYSFRTPKIALKVTRALRHLLSLEDLILKTTTGLKFYYDDLAGLPSLEALTIVTLPIKHN